jgi:hypothetical protein
VVDVGQNREAQVEGFERRGTHLGRQGWSDEVESEEQHGRASHESIWVVVTKSHFACHPIPESESGERGNIGYSRLVARGASHDHRSGHANDDSD